MDCVVHGVAESDTTEPLSLPGCSDSKQSACGVGDAGSIPETGRCSEEGLATHSSILAWRIPWMDRGAWGAIVHGVANSRTRLND